MDRRQAPGCDVIVSVMLHAIRWMLSRTPAERLAVLQKFVNSVLAIRARNAEL